VLRPGGLATATGAHCTPGRGLGPWPTTVLRSWGPGTRTPHLRYQGPALCQWWATPHRGGPSGQVRAGRLCSPRQLPGTAPR